MWENMQYGYGDGYGWMHGGGGWLGMGLHGLIWVLILAALIAAIFWAVRAANGAQTAGRGGEGRPDAMEILDERYARGEIEREDYVARKADLEIR